MPLIPTRQRNAFRPNCQALEARELPATAWALFANNLIGKVDTLAPALPTALVTLTGFQTNERIVGIDFRPADGRLYALGATPGTTDTGRLYTVNLQTGALTAVGTTPFATDLVDATRWGWDFNPTVDRIRVVNESDENGRVNPNNGARADVPVNDTNLTPAGSKVIAEGYTNNFVGSTKTSLYGISVGSTSSLVLQGGANGTPSPNLGAITNVGALGVNIAAGTDAGFDITAENQAFAALTEADGQGVNRTGLYTIDLATGKATSTGLIGDGKSPVLGLAVAPLEVFATGPGTNGSPIVNLYNADGTIRLSFMAYDASFAGGVRVATGDVNRDGVPDVITGAGKTGGPHVKVFSGKDGAQLVNIYAYDPNFTGGVYVGSGDVNGDGFADIITGAGAGGGPHVKAFSGADPSVVLASFFAFDASFAGGVRVSAGDFNADFKADILAATGTGGSQVVAFNAADLGRVLVINAPPVPFGGGLYVSSGDVNGDGRSDVITSTDRGPATVNTFTGTNGDPLLSFNVLNSAPGGATVAGADITGDGFADYIVGNNKFGSTVQVLNNADRAVVATLQPFGGFRGGVFVG